MLISVAGASSRAGKTAAAVTVLRALPGAAAVKFTTAEDAFTRCPRGTQCAVCNIDLPYRLVEDPGILRQPGTDTDRMAAAGARQVLWAIAKRGSAPAAWEAVRARLDEGPVVIEGSSVVELARPDLLIFVAHPFLRPERWKETSPVLIRDADLVVVNRPSGERRRPAASVMAALEKPRRGRGVVVADVTRGLEEWAPGFFDRYFSARALADAR